MTGWRSSTRAGHRPHRLTAVQVTRRGISYGTPHGGATLAGNCPRHTLTVTVQASGVSPGPHAAHIHLGSCMSQGPVAYMLRDLVANRHGRIVHAVRVFATVMTPIPAHGWYLNTYCSRSRKSHQPLPPTLPAGRAREPGKSSAITHAAREKWMLAMINVIQRRLVAEAEWRARDGCVLRDGCYWA